MLNDFNNSHGTELRMPGIKTYLQEKLGAVLEQQGFKFRKSDYTFRRKRGNRYEQIQFLFYDYFPLNYSFEFIVTVFNEQVENIKLALPEQSHYEKFNKFSLFISANNFTNFFSPNSLTETGYHFTVTNLDDLIKVGESLTETFNREVIPLANRLTTIDGIDRFFIEKTPLWPVESGFMNNMATDLIVAKLNGQRDHYQVYQELSNKLKSRDNIDWRTLELLDNLYLFLKNRSYYDLSLLGHG